jgi:hypothetical protein
MFFDKKVKKMDGWDLGLVKLTVAAAVLFIVTISSTVMGWVQSISPWYFLIIAIIFAIRPLYRIYMK